MKLRAPWKSVLVLAFLMGSGLTGHNAFADEVKTLRGAQVDEPVVMEPSAQPKNVRLNREFRQQPPLVPHSTGQYQVDLRANECLNCHDWSNAGSRKAPTLSMTHYTDRDGHQLDQVAGTRWFCTQCHVPQVDAQPLVENNFTPSSKR
ncbi:nitrate reductase cytochrome c-type subunit [Flexibacterium corallicola]|uniref:nitrate reductase cytochrome c-type subunit n=1 Tax=Flexibacterium corallicola TaxID=3037259 RepID=UPI00286F25DC|nr:nitrate reductase cytochrome c-type subunit [Pseudovibrio sp. M1P-2-3]